MPSDNNPSGTKIFLISLGCPRTLVDSEVYLGKLAKAGYQIADSIDDAQVAIINTCSFVQDATKESVDTILDVIDLKKKGKLKSVIVAGCMVQRFKQDLANELPEVDGFVGIDGFCEIESVIEEALSGKRTLTIRKKPSNLYSKELYRFSLTPSHYAYLKISEGCLKGCSFCVIPKIKGPLVSRPMDELLDEAKKLVYERGVRELIIVGQDTSDYGIDIYKRARIAELLEGLGRLKELRWIRLLYCHPKGISDELIEAIRDVPNVCKYLDSAIEHAHDPILEKMNRAITANEMLKKIEMLRHRIPGIALRTSIIVGFPGENEEAFQALLSFIDKVRFDRLGAFIYSKEEGSASFSYPGHVPEGTKKKRFDVIMKAQQKIASELNASLIGKNIEVIIDEADKSQEGLFIGRSQSDAPEVDGLVYVKSKRNLSAGSIITTKITDTYEYDLVGEELIG